MQPSKTDAARFAALGAMRAVLWTTIGMPLAGGALAAVLPRHVRPEDAAA